jgi:hypothetical protein
MHTEHLQNVSVARVSAAWLVAIAVTSLVALTLISSGLMTEDATTANTWWSVLAVVVGFFAGGFFVGIRALQAPVLHAGGVALATLVAWALLNGLGMIFFRDWSWPQLTAQLAVGLLLTQFIAATLGALIGYNVALRGKPGLSEHEPV